MTETVSTTAFHSNLWRSASPNPSETRALASSSRSGGSTG